MNPEDINRLIQGGESSTVEFKSEKVHPIALAEEIVAFANFEGGTVLIGVNDAGKIEGCSRLDIEAFVINVCRNNVRPSIIPRIEKTLISGKLILSVVISEGDTAYATSQGRYYIRVGSTKQIPTQQELLRLFQKRNLLQFDETPVLKASINSIDIRKVNDYLARMGQTPLDEEDEAALIRDLLNLSILIQMDDRVFPTMAGILGFGKLPQKFFPSYSVMCGAYEGSDFSGNVIRETEVTGTLDALIEDAMAFIRLTVPRRHRMDRDVRAEVDYAYPLPAVREAIVNAVCHRDYTIAGSAIRLFVFDGRLEIRSPGGLPNTLTLESMKYRQFTRNQMLASFLSGWGYMEKRGKGVRRMLEESLAMGVACRIDLTPDSGELVVAFSR